MALLDCIKPSGGTPMKGGFNLIEKNKEDWIYYYVTSSQSTDALNIHRLAFKKRFVSIARMKPDIVKKMKNLNLPALLAAL